MTSQETMKQAIGARMTTPGERVWASEPEHTDDVISSSSTPRPPSIERAWRSWPRPTRSAPPGTST
ncbi:hypothetical protein BN381_40007 [Candidatus Microthrix parvicella RN1]|jgi:hypothetical protein|uniref:Uncharacterized protein n=1 Tax=Candidatus Neomicrothrix parvicella RN1 TaxID=1229780 RepID=R4Z100_9ACTN|nr:hypothetical protein BN381_40007 [Candidatus Microthrix parvicella RN1]